jgi:U3 small nucleolar RNA-associated protein 3
VDDQDEVMALDLPSSESDANDIDGEEEEDVEEDEPAVRRRFSKDHDPVQQSKISRYDRPDAVEVDEDGEEEESDGEAGEEEEEEEAWNPASYHVSRRGEAAEADSDDEEALAMDLAEARRIQKAARETLAADDFALPAPESRDEERLPELQKDDAA